MKTANLLGQEADEQCHGVYEDLTGTSRHTLGNKPPPWVSVVRVGSDVVHLSPDPASPEGESGERNHPGRRRKKRSLAPQLP